MTISIYDSLLLGVSILLIGVAIGQMIRYEDMKTSKEIYDKILNLFFTLAGIYILILIYITFFETDLFNVKKEKYPILAAIGIILSAFIASISVMRNIENTNIIEKKKETQIRNKAEILFSTIKSTILSNINKQNLKLIDIKTASKILEDSLTKIEADREVISLCNSKEILTLIVEIQLCINNLTSIHQETGNQLNEKDTKIAKDAFKKLEKSIDNIFNNNNIKFINILSVT